jgi:hypothetical protein
LLEKPFQKEGATMDDVSLFLLEECQKNILDNLDNTEISTCVKDEVTSGVRNNLN